MESPKIHMNILSNPFLTQRWWPYRIGFREASLILGVAPEEISVLISYKLLTPLGSPGPNSPKYFATVQIEKLRDNLQWIETATTLLDEYWTAKKANQRKK